MKILALCVAFLAFSTAGIPAYVVNFEHDSRIVFTSNMGGNDDIYLLSRNRLERLTDDPASDQWPVPDGKGEKIVFTSNRAGNFDIYMMDLKSRKIERLTSDVRDEVSPSWSADESHIFYDLTVGRNAWQTMTLDVQSKTSVPLFPKSPFSSTIVPFSDPKGNEIFFTGKVLLGWLVAKYTMTDGRYTKLTKTGSCRPKVAPDGARIAYVCHDDDGLGDVFLMNADGGGKVNITPRRADSYDYYPCFSPAGDMIVFPRAQKVKARTAISSTPST
jgi:beta propeller repeat protein